MITAVDQKCVAETKPTYAPPGRCRSRATVTGVDGQPSCRMHARNLEHRLDAWAAEVAQFEAVLGIPDWLPEDMHSEWLKLRRDYYYARGDDTDFVDSIFAITRMHQIRKEYGNGQGRL